jgi:Na+/glutamate symporter
VCVCVCVMNQSVTAPQVVNVYACVLACLRERQRGFAHPDFFVCVVVVVIVTLYLRINQRRRCRSSRHGFIMNHFQSLMIVASMNRDRDCDFMGGRFA